MRTIAFLLLVACAARAQDSLVERFESELRALVRRVDAAAAEAVVSTGTFRHDFTIRRDAKWPEVAQDLRAPGSAILVGAPPRVVAAYSAVGDAERLTVRVGGRDVEATRWGGDADLGVVVFKLPDDVAKGLKGVDVEGDWSRVAAGSVAVASDGRGHGGGNVGLVTAAELRLGIIDVAGDGAAVFGSKGTLIGLRGGADMSSCLSCHQTSGFTMQPDLRFITLRSLKRDPWGQGAGGALQNDVVKKSALWALTSSWPHPPGHLANAPQDTDRLVAGPVIRRVLDDLETHGAIRLAFLGVVLGDVAGEQAVQITAVVPDSPAAAAGLAAGQRIEAIDGLACPSAALLSRVLVLRRPGDEVTLSVGGKEIKVRLGERSAARSTFANTDTVGLSCLDLSADLRRFLGHPDDLRGVVVQDVTPGSSAAEAGLQRGDVITRGGGGEIADMEELNAALAGARGKITLTGLRVTDSERLPIGWSIAVP